MSIMNYQIHVRQSAARRHLFAFWTTSDDRSAVAEPTVHRTLNQCAARTVAATAANAICSGRPAALNVTYAYSTRDFVKQVFQLICIYLLLHPRIYP